MDKPAAKSLQALYKRFIDDLIMVWYGNEVDLGSLLSSMNTNDQSIRLTWDISTTQVHFLDLEISNTPGDNR